MSSSGKGGNVATKISQKRITLNLAIPPTKKITFILGTLIPYVGDIGPFSRGHLTHMRVILNPFLWVRNAYFVDFQLLSSGYLILDFGIFKFYFGET